MPRYATARSATIALGAFLLLFAAPSAGQVLLTTAFTYQGRLDDAGAPAHGPYDLRFALWDASTGGTQIGSALCLDNLDITGGLLTVELDFGAEFDGRARWLEIGVRPGGAPGNCQVGAYTTLSPRQSVTAAPYSLYAAYAGDAGIPTVAALRAAPIPTAPPTGLPMAHVLGYRSVGDGGGGEFRWDAASTAADDGGLVIAPTGNPPSGRWHRVFSGPVHVAWWGPLGNGLFDDTAALQAAFDAAARRGIVLPTKTYAFYSPLIIRADTQIQNNGAVLYLRASPGGLATALDLEARVSADLIQIRLGPGVQASRLMLLGPDNTIDRIDISAVEQQSQAGSNLNGALQVRSDNIRLGHVSVTDFNFAVMVYQANHLVVEHLSVRDYLNGFHVRESSFVELLSADITTPAPGATTVPGHNGLLFETSTDVVVSDAIVHDAGEHAVRIGGFDAARFVFNNIQSIRPGQCGLKINPDAGFRVRDVQINGLTVVDAAATSTPGSNEDGLRLEKCSYVTVNGFQVEARDRAASCFDGIYINGCDFVTINGPRITNARANGIHLQDIDGAVNQIFVNNPSIIFTGGHGIYINSPTQILRDITVMGCYIRGQSGFGIRLQANAGTVGVNQPVILAGWIKNEGLGGVSISTTDPDVHNATTIVP